MNTEQKNWYIQYDYRTLMIIHNPNFRVLIFKQAESFNQIQSPAINTAQQEQIPTPPWMNQIAEAMIQILILLFNFFNVQYKLSKNQLVKSKFSTICSVLRIQNQYCKYFNRMSFQFRINRILACSIRLNRFMSCILDQLSMLKKHMDQTLLDNLNQVYLFMQQRIRQTLQATNKQSHYDLNVILLDMLSLLLRNAGDQSMKGILDINKQNQIINSILKSNEVYDQFMNKKMIERKVFEDNKHFVINGELEEDPKAKKVVIENQGDQDEISSHDQE